MIGISTALFLVNIMYSWKKYPAGDNPWDGHTLEWFTTSPPPHHNFYRLPQIRSERPTWDYNHPGHSAAAHGHAAEALIEKEPVSHEERSATPLVPRNLLRRMMVVYWFWSHENAGSVMMFCGMLLCFLPGSYYYFWSRRMKPRAEDDPHATQASGCGRRGHFSRHVDLALHLGHGRLLRGARAGLWHLVGRSRTRSRVLGTHRGDGRRSSGWSPLVDVVPRGETIGRPIPATSHFPGSRPF
jgi:hypothetical protein